MDSINKETSFCQKENSVGLRRKEAYASICDLSIELFDIVISSLHLSDWMALRFTCKALNAKTFHMFWKTLISTVKTDMSDASLGKLEAIPQNARLQGYVKHIVFMGFDENGTKLGGGYEWNLRRSGFSHLVNIQEHPAVIRLSNILSQLNCKSFEIFNKFVPDSCWPDFYHLSPTDMITVFLDIVSRTHIPVTAFSIDMFDFRYPDPQKLQASDKEKFVALGQSLEELKLLYEIEDGIVSDWTFNLLCHAPNLRTLHLMNTDTKEVGLVRRCALVDGMWPQLRDLRLECVSMSIVDLMALLKNCRNNLRVFQMENLRIKADTEGIRQMILTISTFPELKSFEFDGVGFGFHEKDDLMYFPTLDENPFIDESQENRFCFSLKERLGLADYFVAYSGPKMDVALKILAKRLESTPRHTWRIR